MNGHDAFARCESLFADYPQAIETTEITGNPGDPWTERSMVLMVPGDGKPDFYILSRTEAPASPFELLPWRAPELTTIEPGDGGTDPGAARVLTDGIPIPGHGSLFGWVSGTAVTALIAAYTQYTPRTPTPTWTYLPWIEETSGQLPGLAARKLLGRWFWEYVRSGDIRDLSDVIASTPGTVFWVDTVELLGSGSCVVARDVHAANGLTLPRGRYVYRGAAARRAAVPSIDTLLRDPSRTDLSPAFGGPVISPGPAAGHPRTGCSPLYFASTEA